jgi:hypothetical protein
VWEGEYALQISYVSIIKGVLLCLLVTTKAFRRKCHVSFIYTEAGYGVERLTKVEPCCAVWHFVLSEVIAS